jgi:regulator of replication initiation timing
MEHKIEDLVTEANMHKERVESMIEENRKVVNESGVLQKTIENQKVMIGVLEKQSANFEKEL